MIFIVVFRGDREMGRRKDGHNGGRGRRVNMGRKGKGKMGALRERERERERERGGGGGGGGGRWIEKGPF